MGEWEKVQDVRRRKRKDKWGGGAKIIDELSNTGRVKEKNFTENFNVDIHFLLNFSVYIDSSLMTPPQNHYFYYNSILFFKNTHFSAKLLFPWLKKEEYLAADIQIQN